MVEVPVLLEHLLSNPLQDLVAAHPRRHGHQTDGLAAQLTLVKAPHRGLLAIARDGDEESVPQGVPFDIPGHVLPRPSHHVRMISLGSIILTVWLDLARLASSLVTLLIHASGSMESRRACSSPSFQSSTLRRKRV